MIRTPALAFLLLLAGGPVIAQPIHSRPGETATADPNREMPPLEVTSDSRAYCSTLSAQIGTSPTLPGEVRDLQVEGRALCNEGQVRGGINRLRRALMVMRSEPEPGSDPAGPP